MLYGVDDRPGLLPLLALGLQHTLLALMFCLYAVIAGQSIGLSGDGLVAYVSTSILLVGLLTLLHALRSRLTTGMLIVAVPSPVALSVYVATTVNYGLPATMGAIILASVLILLCGRLLPRLRPAFPPEVVGVVVLSLGLSMIAGGITRGVGLLPAEGGGAGAVAALPALTAGVTLLVIVVVSVWGGGRLRIMAVLLGALCGAAVAWATGQLGAAGPPVATDAAGPIFAVPLLGLPMSLPGFTLLALLPILLVQLIAAIDGLADALIMDKLNDAQWRRADMAMAGRSINTTAFANILCGLLGSLPLGTSSAHIGLVRATGASARRIGIATGAALMILAFLPPVSGLIVGMPAAVTGGILLYTAAYLITAGMELALSRLLDTRRSFTIGLSVVAGGAVMLVPQLVQSAPDWSRPMVGSGLAVAASAAILLNLLFRIGTGRLARMTLTAGPASREAAEFLEQQGRIWGARGEVVTRAGLAVGEAVETLARGDLLQGPVELVVSFDEFNLVCTLLHDGAPLPLGAAAPGHSGPGHGGVPDVAAALDGDDDALERAMQQVSAALIQRLADRVQSLREGGRAALRLQFDH